MPGGSEKFGRACNQTAFGKPQKGSNEEQQLGAEKWKEWVWRGGGMGWGVGGILGGRNHYGDLTHLPDRGRMILRQG